MTIRAPSSTGAPSVPSNDDVATNPNTSTMTRAEPATRESRSIVIAPSVPTPMIPKFGTVCPAYWKLINEVGAVAPGS